MTKLKLLLFFCFFATLHNTTPLQGNCCCPYWYVGVEGGWCRGLGHPDEHSGVGGVFTAIAHDAKATSGYNVGVNLGRRWNCYWRTDISYNYLHPRKYNWFIDQPPVGLPAENNIPFKAKLDAHVILANAYFHLNGILPVAFFDPYINAGFGFTFNRLHDIVEISLTNGSRAPINSKTTGTFAARFGVGILKEIFNCWIFDVGFNAYYIGNVHTGSFRTNADGSVNRVGVTDFKNNWIGTVNVGVKYAF